MKHMRNRVLAMLLALAMLFTMAPAVLAEEPAAASGKAEAVDGENPFTDVAEGDYYYRPVLWGLNYDVTNGTTATTFSPDAVCTRAEAVTLYFRAGGGAPGQTYDGNPYTDVSENDYYYEAAMWCYDLGLTFEEPDGTFNPEEPVTRLQFVSILYRYLDTRPEEDTVSPFVDMPADEWEAGAVLWCYQNGIVQGTDATHFSPDDVITRGQVMTILWRLWFDDDEVTIFYTNDVHTYINNDGLTYANVAAMKKAAGKKSNVLLVDAGDHVQGTAYGAMDSGMHIIQLMNAAGYDVATLGNHEFDYGQKRLFELMDAADFPYVSCNFCYTADNSLVLSPYEILDAGGIRVAFIGITTPETYTGAPKAYFINNSGRENIGILGVQDSQDLYDSVQAAIDAIGDQADYIVALGHLGVNRSQDGWTSLDVIEHTTGLDAFIDGHSHTVMENNQVTDASGNQVTLTQTGCYLNAVGEMTIKDGKISTKLRTSLSYSDDDVQAMTDEWVDEVEDALGEKIAVSDDYFYTTDPATGIRMVRNQESNLGDLIADSVYWYFNEEKELECDCAIINGGGLRADLADGDVTYLSSKMVQTFGNVECLLRVKGATIREMLEYSAQYIGETNSDGTPVEFGGFLHTAGIRYTIDTSIPSTVQTNSEGRWINHPTGEYRVKDIEIYNRETGAYEPLKLDRNYTIGGINYILRNGGNGYQMFDDAELVLDYVGEDYMIAAAYLAAFRKGEDGWAHISTANSPLAAYSGYLLDYENPYGAGRVTIR